MTTQTHLQSQRFVTRDGVSLHFIEGGEGRPLVFVPGWSQTAAMFTPILKELAQDHRVIAIDHRGHGESDKPPHGYRLARLAADLAELIAAHELSDVTLIGHSMGCAVIWSYLELYGERNISRLVLIDQAPVVTSWPDWSEEQKALCGCLHTPESIFAAVMALSSPEAAAVSEAYIRQSLFTPECPRDLTDRVLVENLKFPRDHSARLLLELACHDWRDVIARIRLPTLLFGAEASIFNPRAQQWVAEKIDGARVEIFSAQEGGSHFMWLENPQKFLRILRDFLMQ